MIDCFPFPSPDTEAPHPLPHAGEGFRRRETKNRRQKHRVVLLSPPKASCSGARRAPAVPRMPCFRHTNRRGNSRTILLADKPGHTPCAPTETGRRPDILVRHGRLIGRRRIFNRPMSGRYARSTRLVFAARETENRKKCGRKRPHSDLIPDSRYLKIRTNNSP